VKRQCGANRENSCSVSADPRRFVLQKTKSSPLISDRIRLAPDPQDALKILSRWDRICNRFVPIIAPEGILNSELKSKTLAEVTKNLREAMGTEDDDDTSGVFAIYEEVPAGHWANGGKILPLSELLKEMGGDVSDERKCEMKALFDGRTPLKSTLAFRSEKWCWLYEETAVPDRFCAGSQ
jgi:hypothetical protein